jgi:hypothetical protein
MSFNTRPGLATHKYMVGLLFSHFGVKIISILVFLQENYVQKSLFKHLGLNLSMFDLCLSGSYSNFPWDSWKLLLV